MPQLGPVIATYSNEPDYKARQSAQLGQLLGAFASSLRRRHDERKQREDAEVNQFLDYAAKDPSAVSPDYASYIKTKYKDRPELLAVVDAIGNRGQLARDMEGSYKSWQQKADEIWGRLQESRAHADAMPDSLPSWYGPMANTAKKAVQGHLASYDEDSIYQEAAKSMSPSEREKAMTYAHLNKRGFPEISMGYEVDPSQLTEAARTLMAAAGTTDATKVADQIRQTLNVAPRQGLLAEKTHLADEDIREATEKGVVERDTDAAKAVLNEKAERLRQTGVAGLENLRHGHDVSEEAQKHGNTLSEIAAREAGSGKATKNETLAAKIQRWQNTSVTEYDKRMHAAVVDAGGQQEHAKAKKAFLGAEGARPRTLNQVQSKQIEQDVTTLKGAGLVADGEEESLALRIAGHYNSITARYNTKSPTEALNQAVLEETLTGAVNKLAASGQAPGLADPHKRTEAMRRMRDRFYALRRAGKSREEALRGILEAP